MNVLSRLLRPRPLWLAAACLLAGTQLPSCAQETAGLTAPGIGTNPPRLFFPLGIGLDPTGAKLYVANANFDRAFNTGLLVELPVGLFDQAAAAPDKILPALPGDVARGKLDSFSGELQVSPDGSKVFVTSRENDLLNVAPINNGTLACPNQNCSENAVHLGAETSTSGDLKMFDPFALQVTTLPVPGQATPQTVVLVSHQSPPLTNDPQANTAFLAIIPVDAVGEKDPFQHGAVRIPIGSFGSNSLAVDPTTGRTFVGGCFQRVNGESVVPCAANVDVALSRLNPLRTLLPTALQTQPSSPVEQINLGSFLGGGITEDVALSADGKTLYVANSSPSALLVLDTPGTTGSLPSLRRVIPLASSPTKLLVLSRPTGDVVLASSERTNSLLVIDPQAGAVLNQLDFGTGTGAYGLASHPNAAGTADRVYVGLFTACGVAAVDVPTTNPAAAQLVGIVGRCP